jgi:UDP-N-acetylmuramoyl-L-alanyl-D-glutamate--2,6-diaminopimelate ligase
MRFCDLYVDPLIHPKDGLIEVTALAADSREVTEGSLFFAISGIKQRGSEYIPQAIAKGAKVILCDETLENIPVMARETALSHDVPLYYVRDLASKIGDFATKFYDYPSRKMCLVGVTGTNGKSSVTYFLASALGFLGKKCGVLGTIGNGYIDNLSPSNYTTLDSISLASRLGAFLADDAEYVAMEVSSHGLAQGRVQGASFDTAIFTNLSHEHLDYHGTMENYAAAKEKLFLMPDLRHAIFNIDDAVGNRFYQSCRETVQAYRITTNPAFFRQKTENTIYATQIEQTPSGLNFHLETPWGRGLIETSLVGQFNVYNLLSVAAFLGLQGFSFSDLQCALSHLEGVPGRMAVMRRPDEPIVVIDYAHTPDALQHALQALSAHDFGKIWCIFGCGGDRDKSKRPLMASIAEQYADHVIVTTDNPRTESPEAIESDILVGFKDLTRIHRMLDRKKAIEYTLKNARIGDVILIAGKGHEDYQEIQGVKYPFSDKAIVLGYWDKQEAHDDIG